MCGFVYAFSPQELPPAVFPRALAAIAHRGPDFSGIHRLRTPSGFHYFGHNRLSIVDLDPRSHQPLRLPGSKGESVLLFNGEIYNYRDLRRKLEGRGEIFHTRGDAEVLGKLIKLDGAAGLSTLVGMWAFVFFDSASETMILSRDRFGEKPLYFAHGAGHQFFVASQPKAFLEFPTFDATLSCEGLANFLARQYVDAPNSIFRNGGQLPPAHYSILAMDGSPKVPAMRPYYQLGNGLGENSPRPPPPNLSAALRELDQHLTTGVERVMDCDVEVGCFLSGGIDSSLVASRAIRFNSKLRTFTLGFSESGCNEAPRARRAAAHIGSHHREKILTPGEALTELEQAAQFWDEPFADSSQVAVSAISRLASQEVKVVIGGDGGDELFHGYQRYRWAEWMEVIAAIGGRGTPFIAEILSKTLSGMPIPRLRDRLGRLLRAFGEWPRGAFYHEFIGCFSPREIGELLTFAVPSLPVETFHGPQWRESFARHDLAHYLPGDIFTKVDRGTMAFGLESRAPLLDIEVAALALAIPAQWHGEKRLLKALARRAYPPGFFSGPKQGFALPLREWLRGPLRDPLCADLSSKRLERQGIFRVDTVSRMVEDFLSGRADFWYKIWCLWAFQKWWNHYGG